MLWAADLLAGAVRQSLVGLSPKPADAIGAVERIDVSWMREGPALTLRRAGASLPAGWLLLRHGHHPQPEDERQLSGGRLLG